MIQSTKKIKYLFKDTPIELFKANVLANKYFKMLGMDNNIDELKIIRKNDPYGLLADLQVRQLQLLPYTNKMVVEKIEPALSKQEILEKTIDKKEGGMCWELNYTFQFAINYIGYNSKFIECQKPKFSTIIREKRGRLHLNLEMNNKELNEHFEEINPHTAIIVNDEWLSDLGHGQQIVYPIPLKSNKLVNNMCIIEKQPFLYLLEIKNNRKNIIYRFKFKDNKMSSVFNKGIWKFDDEKSLWKIWKNVVYNSILIKDSYGNYTYKIEKSILQKN